MSRRPLSKQRVREIAAGYSAIHDVETVPLAEEVERARKATPITTASLRRLKQRIANILHEQPASVRKNVNAAIDAWSVAERKKA